MTGLRAGGPETYDTCLARALAEVDKENAYTVYCTTPAAIPSFAIQQENFRFHTLTPASRWISIPVTLPWELFRRPVDLFHATYVPPPWFPGRLIYTLLDLSMFSNPELYPAAIRLRLQVLVSSAIRRAEYVLTISEFCKQELIERFSYPAERVFVTYLGVEQSWSRIEDPAELRTRLKVYGIDTPYFLHVGRLQARKNLVRLVKAFHQLREQERIPHKLVLVGRESWESADVFETIQRLGLEKHVIHVGYAPTEDLPHFYTGAEAVVFASLFEGFGIPVIEAMHFGAPVVTSNTTSLPEVAGDAALLVDPHSHSAIAEGMYQLISNVGLRERLRSQGIERSRLFTWRETAIQTRRVYELALGQHG